MSYRPSPAEAGGQRHRLWQHLQWLEPLLSTHRSVSGCIALSLCMLPFLLLFWGMHGWALIDPDAGRFYRRDWLLPVQGLLTVVIALLAGIATLYWPRYRSGRPQPLLVLVTTCTLFFTLSGLTVLYGHKDAPLAIVQLGLLLPAIAIAVLLVLGSEALIALDRLPYAPLLTEPIHTGGTLHWWWNLWVRVIYDIAVLLFAAMLFFLFWLMDRRQLQLETQARIDALTGLCNRVTFMRHFDEENRKQLRTRRPACVLMCDIDHFKRINDSHGHAAGDAVLRRFGELLRGAIRHPLDVAARFGGEEFCVLLPETDLPAARQVAERICAQLRGQVFTAEQDFRVTVSIGVAEVRDGNGERALRIADEQLYRAKHAGRDRVMSC